MQFRPGLVADFFPVEQVGVAFPELIHHIDLLPVASPIFKAITADPETLVLMADGAVEVKEIHLGTSRKTPFL
jgi:hypothetical protein